MKNVLVIGSIAYDHIMFFDGSFKKTILPEQLDDLSISFLAEQHEIYFGGCATNIAYTLRLLDDEPLICGVAGRDFAEYRDWLARNHISTKHILINQKSPTAAAYILNDNNQNQISIFSTIAAEKSSPLDILSGCDLAAIDLAILAPDIPKRMIKVSEELVNAGIPFVFDPGQAISALSKEYLAMIIDGCVGIIANEYETHLLEKVMRMNHDQIVKWAGFYVETLGENGCTYYQNEKQENIPAISGLRVVDVTGCGDAFRSGFLHGYVHKKPLKECCIYGNTAASFVIDEKGTQTHFFTEEEFNDRLKEFYKV